MWRCKRPDPEQVVLLRSLREQHDLRPLVIHGSYLINLAAPAGSEIRDNSIQGLRGELERAILIGAEYLVIHPGTYRGLHIAQGTLNVAEAIALAWRGVDPELARDAGVTLLLENTAGAGAQLGGKLVELKIIRELASLQVDLPVGYCLDTCHCYVSGFDISIEAGFLELVDHAGATLGLQNVPVIHANDTKMELGSHRDRHANIGSGYIGLEGFRRILNHPEFAGKAFILETPVDEPGDDLRNVRALKELVSPSARLTSKKSKPGGISAGRKMLRST